MIPDTKHRDINIRVQLGMSASDVVLFTSDNFVASFLGAHLAGIGRAGIVKVLGVMNLAQPVKEDHYEEIDRRILLPCIKKFQDQSMQAAICMQFLKKSQ